MVKNSFKVLLLKVLKREKCYRGCEVCKKFRKTKIVFVFELKTTGKQSKKNKGWKGWFIQGSFYQPCDYDLRQILNVSGLLKEPCNFLLGCNVHLFYYCIVRQKFNLRPMSHQQYTGVQVSVPIPLPGPPLYTCWHCDFCRHYQIIIYSVIPHIQTFSLLGHKAHKRTHM